MYKITKLKTTNNVLCYWFNLKKLLKSIGGFAVLMLFMFATNSLQAQIVDNESAIIADFGIDGDAYDSVMEFLPWLTPPGEPSADAIQGTDDWFEREPDNSDLYGAGVIMNPTVPSLPSDDYWDLFQGANVTAELRMSAPNNSTPEDANIEWIDAVYGRDQYVSGGNQDMTVYAQAINKNFDDPRSWTFKEGDVPQKTDIIDVYAHLRRDTRSGPPEEYVYVGASTSDADGSNHIDFEFFRKAIDFNASGMIYYPGAGDGDECGHTAYHFDYDAVLGYSIGTDGDVLLSMDYINGGTQGIATYLIWVDKAEIDAAGGFAAINSASTLLPFEFYDDGNGFVFAQCTNLFEGTNDEYGYAQVVFKPGKQYLWSQLNTDATTEAPPWGFIDGGGNLLYEYPETVFAELVVDATALLGFSDENGACDTGLASIFVKSRSSASFTSSLKDGAGPYSLVRNPDIMVSVNSPTICEGDDPVLIQATVTTASLGPFSYAWTVPVGVSDPGSVVSFSSSVAGNYSVIVTDLSSGCSAESLPGTLTVNPNPSVSVGDQVECDGDDTVTFSTADLGAGYSYQWYLNDVAIGGATSNSYTTGVVTLAMDGGVYKVVVTNDATGCDSDDSGTLTVNPNPSVSVGDQVECDGDDTVTFSTADLGAGYSYQWYLNDVAIGGATSNSYTTGVVTLAMDGGVYKVVVTNDATGCDSDDSGTLTVNPNPDCTASNSSEGSEFGLCEGTTLNLNVTPADTNLYTYLWTSNGSANITDDDMPNATADNVVDGEVFTVVITNKVTGCDSYCTTTARYYDCTPNCGTAYAVKTEDVGGYDSVVEDINEPTFSSCFRNDGFKRWGWTNTISEHGTYTYAVYRGAGRCDLSKGTYVGDLIVEYTEEGMVNFSYDLLTWDDDNDANTPEVPLYLISEVHLYVGCNPYPFKSNAPDDLAEEDYPDYYTVAPGQYSYNANIPEGDYYPGYEASLSGVSGAFYFIAHAVICDRDIPYPDGMHIPGEQSDYGEIDPLTPNVPIDGDCTVPTDGWGKLEGKKLSFTAYPVPFQNEVNIGYKFEYDTDVKIDVYDIKGALIRQAENTSYLKGTYDRTNIDLSGNDDQMYFVRVTTREGTLVKKIVSSTEQQ
ncbi:T9SS type A sorting domain-containing protein [Aestuariivivens sediminis]|uniref:T9SS type A sorting domain-containing protein n=1 Tax=Aestuariivivens sediminis TaxID=2913557 RepID=UPI001F572810|nr:T9SS type A sorting domain-containing protein [Aestuariivivens sediminis]